MSKWWKLCQQKRPRSFWNVAWWTFLVGVLYATIIIFIALAVVGCRTAKPIVIPDSATVQLDPDQEYFGLCRRRTVVTAQHSGGLELWTFAQKATHYWNTAVGRDLLSYEGTVDVDPEKEGLTYIVVSFAPLLWAQKWDEWAKKTAFADNTATSWTLGTAFRTLANRSTSATLVDGEFVQLRPRVAKQGPTQFCTVGGHVWIRTDDHYELPDYLEDRDLIAIHELGHMLGLTDRSDSESPSIMRGELASYGDARFSPNDYTKAEMEFLYGPPDDQPWPPPQHTKRRLHNVH